jgi:hypothetical protein
MHNLFTDVYTTVFKPQLNLKNNKANSIVQNITTNKSKKTQYVSFF